MQLVQILPRRWRESARGLATSGTSALNRLNGILPERLRDVSPEVAKFGVIGVINLAVNFAVSNLLWLTVLSQGQLWAKGIATIVATTCAYFMNRHWTYRDRPKSTLRREYTLFLFFNGVGLVIEVAVVGVAKYGFGETHWVVLNLCTGVGIVLGSFFRFWAYRNHVFKIGEETAEEPVLESAAAAFAAVPDAADEPRPTNGGAKNGSANGTVANGVLAGGVRLNGHAHGVRAKGVRAKSVRANGVEPRDESLAEELTQIELDDIVAGEQTATKRHA